MTVICVEDVGAHWVQARQTGAEIIEEAITQLYGDRTHTARDPKGHKWAIHTHDFDPQQPQAEESPLLRTVCLCSQWGVVSREYEPCEWAEGLSRILFAFG